MNAQDHRTQDLEHTQERAACPVCREIHEADRGLSFDGKGVNACGMYRTRLATFTSGATDNQVRDLGPVFAAAPDLLAALEAIIGTGPDRYGYVAAGNALDDEKREAARAAIAKARETA